MTDVKRVHKRRLSLIFAMCFMLLFSLTCSTTFFGGIGDVYAKQPASSSKASEEKVDNSTDNAKKQLTIKVASSFDKTTWDLEGGGVLAGEDLWQGGQNSYRTLNEGNFMMLTSKAQDKVVAKIAQESQNAVGESNISDQTVQNWWKELQQVNGVGTKFLGTILSNTKPDFVTANAIYKPFSGVVGTALGLGAVLLMAFLGLVMVMDISYITLPPVRLFVSDDENGEKIAKSKMFSHDAIYAVQKAESDSQGNGSPKQALGIYLKRRIIALILLGICLMYLVQGQLYTFVGWILDMLNGFLGF